MKNFNALRQPGQRQQPLLPGAAGESILFICPAAAPRDLDLSATARSFTVHWFNPRAGGGLQTGRIAEVKGPGKVSLGPPPAEADQDWVALVKAR